MVPLLQVRAHPLLPCLLPLTAFPPCRYTAGHIVFSESRRGFFFWVVSFFFPSLTWALYTKSNGLVLKDSPSPSWPHRYPLNGVTLIDRSLLWPSCHPNSLGVIFFASAMDAPDPSFFPWTPFLITRRASLPLFSASSPPHGITGKGKSFLSPSVMSDYFFSGTLPFSPFFFLIEVVFFWIPFFPSPLGSRCFFCLGLLAPPVQVDESHLVILPSPLKHFIGP